jgi:hypothetical protein
MDTRYKGFDELKFQKVPKILKPLDRKTRGFLLLYKNNSVLPRQANATIIHIYVL